MKLSLKYDKPVNNMLQNTMVISMKYTGIQDERAGKRTDYCMFSIETLIRHVAKCVRP